MGDVTFFGGVDAAARIGFQTDDDYGVAGTLEFKPLGLTYSDQRADITVGGRFGVAVDFGASLPSVATGGPMAELEVGWTPFVERTFLIARLNAGYSGGDRSAFRYGVGLDLPFTGFNARSYFGFSTQYNGFVADQGVDHRLTFGFSGAFDMTLFDGLFR